MNNTIDKKDFISFIIGTVLGDSSLCGKKNKYLFMGHCEKQLEYLKWKEQIIKENLPVGVNFKQGISMTSPSNHRQNFYKIFTTTHHKLTAIYKITYNDKNIKFISKEALNKLTPLGLAVLFMDDGCKEVVWNRKKTFRYIKSFKISLGGFVKEEVQLLSDYLLETYNIESKIYLEYHKYPCLKITTNENKDKFINLIKPYIINSMKYKITIQE